MHPRSMNPTLRTVESTQNFSYLVIEYGIGISTGGSNSQVERACFDSAQSSCSSSLLHHKKFRCSLWPFRISHFCSWAFYLAGDVG